MGADGMGGTPVVFLDRDGVLCEEHGYVTSFADLRIFPYARDSVERLHALGYLAIVVTNQAAVAKGLVSEEDVAAMHERLVCETGVDAVYCCPHYPPAAGDPEAPPYRVVCGCRKPRTGLIEQARRNFELDMTRSWFVGDRAGDIMTGQAVGVRTVLLESGYGTARLENPVEPDMVFAALPDFAAYLEREHERNAVSTI